MTTSSFSPDDFRAAAEVHAELPADYRDAVVESFLDKIGREIDARVDARVDGQRRPEPAAAPRPARARRDRSLVLPIVSLAAGIPLTAMVLGYEHGNSAASFGILLLVWAALVVINVAHSRRQN